MQMRPRACPLPLPHYFLLFQDYALGNVGTPNDICVTEAMLFPTGWMGSGPPGAALGRSTRGSPHSMGSLAASVAERWAFRKAQEATQQSITFFRSSDSIKKHVDRLRKQPHQHSDCMHELLGLLLSPFSLSAAAANTNSVCCGMRLAFLCSWA